MSHYSHRGGEYRGGGGYQGHRNGYGKINEDDVPASKHSIFIRGIPSSVTPDQIKTFFEDNIGPCSFDFQKINHERQSIFVAVRFETKDEAKKAYNRYRDEDILGCRCEVSWFRDIRRYITYQQQTGGVIRRGSFGRGGVGRYYDNNSRPEYRKRRYSDDRRSRSRSYSDSDRSRSRSRRSSNSDRSRSRSEGRRSTSRESDRRRSESKDEKKVKKARKERRSRRSESTTSRSDGERSRSRSARDHSQSNNRRTKSDRANHDVSPVSSTGSSPLKMKAKKDKESGWSSDVEIIQVEKKEKENEPNKLMITIVNKATVPVENTSFKMSLDTDEPPRMIIRSPLTPEKKKEDDAMEVEEKEEEVPLRKEVPKEKEGSDKSASIIDVTPEVPPAPALIQPTLATVNGSPKMVPRSVTGPHPPSMATPNPPPPKRPPMGTPSSLPPPPPGRVSLGGGGSGCALALKCPEMAKTVKEIKIIQDQLISTVKPSTLRLSEFSNGESAMEKMEERERLINELDPMQKNKLDIKMKQIANSYRGDASTITTVIKSVVQKDPSLEDRIKPALLAVLEDLEKQIYKKVDDFLVCGL